MNPARMLLFFAALHTTPKFLEGDQVEMTLDCFMNVTNNFSAAVLQADMLKQISTGDLSKGACGVALQAIPQVAQYLWLPEGSNPQREEENESLLKKAVKYSTDTYCSLSQTLLIRFAFSVYKAARAAEKVAVCCKKR